MRPALAALLACGALAARAGPEPVRREWTVGGQVREALVYAPAAGPRPPVVFVWHGHGGDMRSAAASFGIHRLWPEAVVVYAQGLPTAGRVTDRQGRRAGWQFHPGEQEDRDLKLFDAILATLKSELHVDEARVYATGHSNGGRFTQVLWAARGAALAAVAPSGTRGDGLLHHLPPKPCLHLAGERDPLVPFAAQQATMEAVRTLNGCAARGEPWARGAGFTATLYRSARGTPLVTVVHPGGHRFPEWAPELIVRFLIEQGGATAHPLEPPPTRRE
ncbi:MAG TPA: dienelactone hydrolase family protein [Vicinamibacteria bacterium]